MFREVFRMGEMPQETRFPDASMIEADALAAEGDPLPKAEIAQDELLSDMDIVDGLKKHPLTISSLLDVVTL